MVPAINRTSLAIDLLAAGVYEAVKNQWLVIRDSKVCVYDR